MKRIVTNLLPILLVVLVWLLVGGSWFTPRPVKAATPTTPPAKVVVILRCAQPGYALSAFSASSGASPAPDLTKSCAQNLADQINAGLNIANVQLDPASGGSFLIYTLVGGAGNQNTDGGGNSQSGTDDNTQH